MIEVDNRGDARTACYAAWEQLGPLVAPVEVRRVPLNDSDIRWMGKSQAVYLELKSSDDLLSSLSSGHMQDQESRMLGLEGAKYLVVIDEFNSGPRGETWTPKKDRAWEFPFAGVVNYLSRIQELGVGLISVYHPEDLGRAIAATYKRSLKEKSQMVARRVVAHLDPRVQALTCIYPYLSRKAAEELIGAGAITMPKVLWDEKKLGSVPGVGKLTAKRLAECP